MPALRRRTYLDRHKGHYALPFVPAVVQIRSTVEVDPRPSDFVNINPRTTKTHIPDEQHPRIRLTVHRVRYAKREEI